jgi:hypothetical protein
MYEAILGRIDAVSASVGLLREEAKVRKGVNPWEYAGGSSSSSTSVVVQVQEKGRVSSERGASTLLEGNANGRDLDLEKAYSVPL